ncbi:hypothetical protein [Limimaricola pyoseonensis]|uniref:YMGG-like Gly-zipper n=1 Tax=Limimaricola pyoseonensis TaxID=521013 RepID=A0A1G7J4H3_9RHOB|nr:hypothetical protein [Limimaricola pyoseonensis]SDF19783.1 hypothetical protein SAMN04488567_3638 [Limimaricola pyoseonensis]
MRITAILGTFAALGLAACGNTDLERAASGAAIGAAAGEVVSGDPAVGAGVGATAGALSDDV